MKEDQLLEEFSFPRLIVVPLSCHEVDGVRKEKERLTAALNSPHFFPATMLLLKAGKKGGKAMVEQGLSHNVLSFKPA